MMPQHDSKATHHHTLPSSSGKPPAPVPASALALAAALAAGSGSSLEHPLHLGRATKKRRVDSADLDHVGTTTTTQHTLSSSASPSPSPSPSAPLPLPLPLPLHQSNTSYIYLAPKLTIHSLPTSRMKRHSRRRISSVSARGIGSGSGNGIDSWMRAIVESDRVAVPLDRSFMIHMKLTQWRHVVIAIGPSRDPSKTDTCRLYVLNSALKLCVSRPIPAHAITSVADSACLHTLHWPASVMLNSQQDRTLSEDSMMTPSSAADVLWKEHASSSLLPDSSTATFAPWLAPSLWVNAFFDQAHSHAAAAARRAVAARRAAVDPRSPSSSPVAPSKSNSSMYWSAHTQRGNSSSSRSATHLHADGADGGGGDDDNLTLVFTQHHQDCCSDSKVSSASTIAAAAPHQFRLCVVLDRMMIDWIDSINNMIAPTGIVATVSIPPTVDKLVWARPDTPTVSENVISSSRHHADTAHASKPVDTDRKVVSTPVSARAPERSAVSQRKEANTTTHASKPVDTDRKAVSTPVSARVPERSVAPHRNPSKPVDTQRKEANTPTHSVAFHRNSSKPVDTDRKAASTPTHSVALHRNPFSTDPDNPCHTMIGQLHLLDAIDEFATPQTYSVRIVGDSVVAQSFYIDTDKLYSRTAHKRSTPQFVRQVADMHTQCREQQLGQNKDKPYKPMQLPWRTQSLRVVDVSPDDAGAASAASAAAAPLYLYHSRLDTSKVVVVDTWCLHLKSGARVFIRSKHKRTSFALRRLAQLPHQRDDGMVLFYTMNTHNNSSKKRVRYQKPVTVIVQFPSKEAAAVAMHATDATDAIDATDGLSSLSQTGNIDIEFVMNDASSAQTQTQTQTQTHRHSQRHSRGRGRGRGLQLGRHRQSVYLHAAQPREQSKHFERFKTLSCFSSLSV
jgi:hypothetical protein